MKELIKDIAFNALEAEAEEFNRDPADYMASVMPLADDVELDSHILDNLRQRIVIQEKDASRLARKLYPLVKGKSDNEAVEILSDTTEAKDTIINAFLHIVFLEAMRITE